MTSAPPPADGPPASATPSAATADPERPSTSPRRRRRTRLWIVATVVIVAVLVALVPLTAVWARGRGAVTRAAVDLPADLCSTLRTAVSDPSEAIRYERVDNTADDRSVAFCRATPDDTKGVWLVSLTVTRTGSTAFADAASRADDIGQAFCTAAPDIDFGELGVGAKLGLQRSPACVTTSASPADGLDPDLVTATIGGKPVGADDTFIGVVYVLSGTDRVAAATAARDLAQRIIAGL